MHVYDTVLLTQKKRPVLDITGFIFCMSTQVNKKPIWLLGDFNSRTATDDDFILIDDDDPSTEGIDICK